MYEYPGTKCALGNGYDIFFLPAAGRASQYPARNDLIYALFDVKWDGNLLVVKRGLRPAWGSAISITRPEIPLIGNFVEQWVLRAAGRAAHHRLTVSLSV